MKRSFVIWLNTIPVTPNECKYFPVTLNEDCIMFQSLQTSAFVKFQLKLMEHVQQVETIPDGGPEVTSSYDAWSRMAHPGFHLVVLSCQQMVGTILSYSFLYFLPSILSCAGNLERLKWASPTPKQLGRNGQVSPLHTFRSSSFKLSGNHSIRKSP